MKSYSWKSKPWESLAKFSFSLSHKFALTFRLVDDLCAINNDSEFEKKSKKIHPPESVLKKEIPENWRLDFSKE